MCVTNVSGAWATKPMLHFFLLLVFILFHTRGMLFGNLTPSFNALLTLLPSLLIFGLSFGLF